MARLSLVTEQPSSRAWDVEVNVAVAHVSVAQAVATALAIDLDFDLDTVDDIRIATDEVCTELADRAEPEAILHVVFDTHGDALEVRAEVEAGDDRSHVLRTWFRKARNYRRGPVG
jgi:serine/threonine-protein kinase RsbW